MKNIISKYAVWTGDKFEVLEKTIIPGKNTIVKVISCAFCGTDKHSIEHSSSIASISFGHEILAEVIYLGGNHKVVSGKSVAVNDRVVVHPGKNCGVCPHCLSRTGHSNLCEHRKAHGHSDFSENDFFPAGGFSSYIEVMDDAWLIPVPKALNNDIAVLAEPLAIAVRAVDRALSGTRPDRDLGEVAAIRAAVIGTGPIGYLIAYVLKSIGADVVGFDLDSFKTTFFKKHLGFEAFTISYEQAKQLDKLILENSKIKDFDVAFECGGTTSAFVAALLAARKAGRVIELGNYIQKECAEIDPAWICRKELDVIGHVLASPYTYEKVFRLIEQVGIEPLMPLVTKKIHLSNIQEIPNLNYAEEMKVVIENDL